MKNVTISLEDSFLASVKEYAARRGVSVNSLVKGALERELGRNDATWVDRLVERAKELDLRLEGGTPLMREEIYDRKALH